MQRERITSTIGFYVGDVSFVLDDRVYDGILGAHGFHNGRYYDPETGFWLAIFGTEQNNCIFTDHLDREYEVDDGEIGIVPLEIVGDMSADEGQYFFGAGEAVMTVKDGVFYISLPRGEIVVIDTNKGELLDSDQDEEFEEEFDDELDEDGDEHGEGQP